MIPSTLDLDAIPIANSWAVSRETRNYTAGEILCTGHLHLASAAREGWVIESPTKFTYCCRCDPHCYRRTGATAWARILQEDSP